MLVVHPATFSALAFCADEITGLLVPTMEFVAFGG